MIDLKINHRQSVWLAKIISCSSMIIIVETKYCENSREVSSPACVAGMDRAGATGERGQAASEQQRAEGRSVVPAWAAQCGQRAEVS